MTDWNEDESLFMLRAIDLARRGEGRVEPNPMVGCVLVRDGRVVGEGFHKQFGAPHAEIHALTAAGSLAHGATAYVTLEPCCHVGKTGPCTQALISNGIARVVAATSDPFPAVRGGGFTALANAGVKVEVGLCGDEANDLLRPFRTRVELGRPFMLAKWASSLDGRIATRTGDSRWISNEASRRVVHVLRGRMDAIMVGIGTALADDPLLTPRPTGLRTPERIVLDSEARLPCSHQLVRTAKELPTTIVAGPVAPNDRLRALEQAGCRIERIDTADRMQRLAAFLKSAAARGITNVLCEGGGQTLGSLFDLNAVDEVHAFIAPVLLGGPSGSQPLQSIGVEFAEQACRLVDAAVQQLDGDIYVRGRLPFQETTYANR